MNKEEFELLKEWASVPESWKQQMANKTKPIKIETLVNKLKENSNYALMYVDNQFVLVDTKDNKFDVMEVDEDE